MSSYFSGFLTSGQLAHKFAAVSKCTTWSCASGKFNPLFPLGVSEFWPMTVFPPIGNAFELGGRWLWPDLLTRLWPWGFCRLSNPLRVSCLNIVVYTKCTVNSLTYVFKIIDKTELLTLGFLTVGSRAKNVCLCSQTDPTDKPPPCPRLICFFLFCTCR